MNNSFFPRLWRQSPRGLRRLSQCLACGALLAWSTPAWAVSVFYDFEGDSGTTVIDKLASDGATNGVLLGNATIDSTPGVAPFGAQAARLQLVTNLNQYTSIELPGTMDLGTAFTLSAFVNMPTLPTDAGITRLFSSYGGTGAIGAGQIIFDVAPVSGLTNGLRFNIGGQSLTPAAPVDLSGGGYRHFAATYDNGVAAVYIDGAPIALNGALAGGPVSTAQNLRFGEDPHNAGGTANEQIDGNVDDLFVVGRALSPAEVASIAAGGVAGNYAPGAETYAIHYDFEGGFADKLVADGAQNAILHKLVSLDGNAANAAFGAESALFQSVPTPSPLSQIDLGPLGNLNDAFTMAAVVNLSAGGRQRLFSSFAGSGSTAGRLIFDFNPDADGSTLGMRVILPNGLSATNNLGFSLGEDHLLAMTYAFGDVKIYLDGVEVASNTGAGGPINLGAFSLRVGEDLGGAANEQLKGLVDDVLIINGALSAEQMMQLSTLGAAEFLKIPEPSTVVLSGLAIAGAALIGRARRRQ